LTIIDVMHLLLFTIWFAQLVSCKVLDKNQNEKLIKVWEDRIQHAELDADEVNFPLFIDDHINDDIYHEKTDEETVNDEDSSSYNSHYYELQNNSEPGMITIRHKVTTNNSTKEGVTVLHSSDVFPMIKNAMNSMTEENMMFLGVGTLLPFLGLLLPFALMAFIVPIMLMVVMSMFGIASAALLFSPMALFGLGAYALSENFFTGSDFDALNTFDESFQALEKVENLDEEIEKVIESISEEEVSLDTTTSNNIDVPRYLTF